MNARTAATIRTAVRMLRNASTELIVPSVENTHLDRALYHLQHFERAEFDTREVGEPAETARTSLFMLSYMYEPDEREGFAQDVTRTLISDVSLHRTLEDAKLSAKSRTKTAIPLQWDYINEKDHDSWEMDQLPWRIDRVNIGVREFRTSAAQACESCGKMQTHGSHCEECWNEDSGDLDYTRPIISLIIKGDRKTAVNQLQTRGFDNFEIVREVDPHKPSVTTLAIVSSQQDEVARRWMNEDTFVKPDVGYPAGALLLFTIWENYQAFKNQGKQLDSIDKRQSLNDSIQAGAAKLEREADLAAALIEAEINKECAKQGRPWGALKCPGCEQLPPTWYAEAIRRDAPFGADLTITGLLCDTCKATSDTQAAQGWFPHWKVTWTKLPQDEDIPAGGLVVHYSALGNHSACDKELINTSKAWSSDRAKVTCTPCRRLRADEAPARAAAEQGALVTLPLRPVIGVVYLKEALGIKPDVPSFEVVQIAKHRGRTYYVTNTEYKPGVPQIIIQEFVDRYEPNKTETGS